jgi:hypothetical protein
MAKVAELFPRVSSGATKVATDIGEDLELHRAVGFIASKSYLRRKEAGLISAAVQELGRL